MTQSGALCAEDTVLTGQCHCASPHLHQSLLPGAVPILHDGVSLTRMGQIPANWVAPWGEEEEEKGPARGRGGREEELWRLWG